MERPFHELIERMKKKTKKSIIFAWVVFITSIPLFLLEHMISISGGDKCTQSVSISVGVLALLTGIVGINCSTSKKSWPKTLTILSAFATSIADIVLCFYVNDCMDQCVKYMKNYDRNTYQSAQPGEFALKTFVYKWLAGLLFTAAIQFVAGVMLFATIALHWLWADSLSTAEQNRQQANMQTEPRIEEVQQAVQPFITVTLATENDKTSPVTETNQNQ